MLATAALLGALLTACATSEASIRPTETFTARPPHTPTSSPALEPATPQALRLDHGRQSPGVIAAGGADAVYNYAPAVMSDGGRYRMWWCSQLGTAVPPGDDILYAESTSLDGGFTGPDGSPGTSVFSGSGRGFDAVHTCDPSVVRAGGTYYLYYGGSDGNPSYGTAIGLATSPDGRTWTRVGDRPIVEPARDAAHPNLYGAGQPSAVFLDGWFYLMFTDTTGRDVRNADGAGQFLLRAKDPTFASGVETITPGGFRPMPDTRSRFRSVAAEFSADLMWVDALDAFAIAAEGPDGTTITFWDKDFRTNPYPKVLIAGPWREGPGLVRRADGHAVIPVDTPCDLVPFDLVRATADTGSGPTALRHFGADLVDVNACATPERAVRTLDGYAMPSPSRTVDLVLGGGIVRVDRRSVAEQIAVQVLDRRLPVLDKIPVTARITPNLPAIRAPGRGLGLIIDNRLWAVPSATVAERNSSIIADVPAPIWDAYERGSDLVAPPR
jgi:hypothetical protein